MRRLGGGRLIVLIGTSTIVAHTALVMTDSGFGTATEDVRGVGVRRSSRKNPPFRPVVECWVSMTAGRTAARHRDQVCTPNRA